MQLGRRAVNSSKFWGSGLRCQDGAACSESRHGSVIVIGYPILKDHRSLGERPVFDTLELLDPEWHAPKWQADVSSPSFRSRSFEVGMTECIEWRR
jgi:hypothetical protein